MNRSRVRTLAFALALGALPAVAAQGDIDPTFGNGGRVRVLDAGRDIPTTFVATDAQGRILLLYARREGTIVRDYAVSRLLEDGRPDESFGISGTTALPREAGTGAPLFHAAAVTVLDDEDILITGYPTNVGPCCRSVKLDAQGQLNASFGSRGDGHAELGAGKAIPLPDGGAILFEDLHDYWNGLREDLGLRLSRMRPDGSADENFGDAGTLRSLPPLSRIFDLKAGPDGGLTVLGYGSGNGPDGAPLGIAAVKLDAAGSIDVGWGVNGFLRLPVPDLPYPFVEAWILSDGSYLTFDGRQQMRRFLPGGGIDPEFGTGGMVALPGTLDVRLSCAARLADGSVLLCHSPALTGLSMTLVKLDSRGRPVEAFGPGGMRTIPIAPQPPVYTSVHLADSGDLYVAGRDSSLAGFPPEASVLTRIQVLADVVEYRNEMLDHYFLTYDGEEARFVDGGGAGPGWIRTGGRWSPGGTKPVCRFYGTPGIGPNSHFFTAEPLECEIVRASTGWTYEGNGFRVTPLQSGACPQPLRTVHRLYNNRWMVNDSNHRYVTDLADVPAMQAAGWVLEGPVFCTRP